WPSRCPPFTPLAKLCPDSGEGTQEPSSPLPRTTSPVASSGKILETKYLLNIDTVCGNTHSVLAMVDHQQELTNTNPPPGAGREKVPPKTSNQPQNNGGGVMEDRHEANVTDDEENPINNGN
ncbi:hypothetical protein PIB30_050766, partial [Stylosanthes scabra]|nr:hypothetical protein [Stylosanthes scabra]